MECVTRQQFDDAMKAACKELFGSHHYMSRLDRISEVLKSLEHDMRQPDEESSDIPGMPEIAEEIRQIRKRVLVIRNREREKSADSSSS